MDNTPRKITITPVMNGFYVQVGCQALVFASIDELTNAVKEYYENPDKTAKKYIGNRINRIPGVENHDDYLRSPSEILQQLRWQGFPEEQTGINRTIPMPSIVSATLEGSQNASPDKN